MNPEHHEERLRMWAITSGRPVVSIDYGKAPECWSFYDKTCPSHLLGYTLDPYPFAQDEAFDTYRVLVESCQYPPISGSTL